MSPFTPYPSSFGRLKCEKILSPRDLDSAAARSPPVSLETCIASFKDAECCDLVGSDPGVAFFCAVGVAFDFAAGADDGPACCCCFCKSLAARCRSCSSLRSALVIDFWEGCAVAVATEAGSARTGTGMVSGWKTDKRITKVGMEVRIRSYRVRRSRDRASTDVLGLAYDSSYRSRNYTAQPSTTTSVKASYLHLYQVKTFDGPAW